MNKGEFVSFIASNEGCSKAEAQRMVDVFTGSVTKALKQGEKISLIGFGSFSVQHVESHNGRDPRTGKPLKIPAYNRPKFKVGQNLKDACNNK